MRVYMGATLPAPKATSGPLRGQGSGPAPSADMGPEPRWLRGKPSDPDCTWIAQCPHVGQPALDEGLQVSGGTPGWGRTLSPDPAL